MLKLQYSTLAPALALLLPALGLVPPAQRGPRPATLAVLNHVRSGPGVIEALRAAGFNAVGGDSDPDLWRPPPGGVAVPRLQLLDLSRHLQADLQTPAVDVYAPGFAAELDAIVRTACRPQAGDALLLGYFSDDGLDWDPATHPEAVLRYYLSLDLSAPGRMRALDFLQDRYRSDIGAVNRAWSTRARDFLSLAPPQSSTAAFTDDARAFGQQVLARYLQLSADAIHAADPNHPYFGAVLAFDAAHPDAAVWSIPDIASVDVPDGRDPRPILTALRQWTAKPLLLQSTGCSPPAVGWGAALSLPFVRGFEWSPSGDWRSGACASAAAAWGRLAAAGN